jgi:energy-converting hydrogenase Eha subunit H
MINIGDVIFQIITILLVVLFFISLFLFVRRLLKNQFYRNDALKRIEDKLDKIIENQERQIED